MLVPKAANSLTPPSKSFLNYSSGVTHFSTRYLLSLCRKIRNLGTKDKRREAERVRGKERAPCYWEKLDNGIKVPHRANWGIILVSQILILLFKYIYLKAYQIIQRRWDTDGFASHVRTWLRSLHVRNNYHNFNTSRLHSWTVFSSCRSMIC